jgi:hypothetical protein
VSITISGESLIEICYLLIISIDVASSTVLVAILPASEASTTITEGVGGRGATEAIGRGGQETSPQRTPQDEDGACERTYGWQNIHS